MTEDGINHILGILERHMFEDEEEIRRHASLFADDANGDTGPQIINGVGVLNLEGPIFPKANLMTELSGATSLESFRSELRSLASSDRVHSILVNVDSPGGVSDLVMETAAEIRAIGKEKPVITIANTMAASAAAWIASAGTESYITDSGLGGSIGVYTVHVDRTEQDKMLGLKKTVIKAGDAKAAHEEPLNEHTRSNLQTTVDDLYKDFVEGVAVGRNLTVEQVTEFADGGIITPRKAVDVGLFDGIRTYESLLAEMSENGGAVGNSSTALTVKALAARGIIVPDDNFRKMFEPDLEHGDVGTTGEPIPKEPQMQDDPAVTGGWRVPSDAQPTFPPAEHQPPPTTNRKGSAMDREQLVALANLVGVDFTEETSDADLYASITSEINDVVVPLNAAAAQAAQRRSFASEFPDEYERYQKLLERDEEHEARVFASRWERFNIKEGDTVKKSTSGFAARVLLNIEDIHLKLSRKQLGESDIATLLDSIAETGAVDYAEKGSARDAEERTSVRELSVKDIRAEFLNEVKEIMEQDGVDRNTAVKLVGERNPELAEAYKTGHLRR